MNDKILALLEQFSGRTVAVVGDLVADLFIYGQAARVSREAPVLIIEHERDAIALGGAANAAHNVLALGGVPLVLGTVGADLYGEMLLQEMSARGIDTQYIVRAEELPTTTKQRIVASGLHTTYQQLVRVDRGSRRDVNGQTERQLLEKTEILAGKAEILIASDYGYGVFSDDMITRISAIAGSEWCQVMVDSRFRPLRFKDVSLLTPNEPEAGAACNIAIRNKQDVMTAAERLLHGANAANIAVTRGREGMYLKSRDGKSEFIPIYGTDQIADVTGAGDTVIAAFALAGACGGDFSVAARLATVAAGLVVMKPGTATVTQAEIRTALEAHPWRE